jgi:hypothetical protein
MFQSSVRQLPSVPRSAFCSALDSLRSDRASLGSVSRSDRARQQHLARSSNVKCQARCTFRRGHNIDGIATACCEKDIASIRELHQLAAHRRTVVLAAALLCPTARNAIVAMPPLASSRRRAPPPCIGSCAAFFGAGM